MNLAVFLESEKLKNRLIEDQSVAIAYLAELLDHFALLCYNIIITVIGELSMPRCQLSNTKAQRIARSSTFALLQDRCAVCSASMCSDRLKLLIESLRQKYFQKRLIWNILLVGENLKLLDHRFGKT